MDDDVFISPLEQPLEFVLVGLDLLTDQETSFGDAPSLESATLEEGFAVTLQLGSDVILCIRHDSVNQRLEASVASQQEARDLAALRLALAMNTAMPVQRRFHLDAQTRGLALTETWDVQALDLVHWVADLRSLIDALDAVLEVGAATPVAEVVPPTFERV